MDRMVTDGTSQHVPRDQGVLTVHPWIGTDALNEAEPPAAAPK
jgi:hypothetical protein